ncbi:hypothetical protein SDC9_156536 [bioreactor metagenome]|uniref:Uncharacterized protein n=1 Tax=bioreactor metagenome TaxID=1076179 RepID=A0A645F4Z0_9ZZZZ
MKRFLSSHPNCTRVAGVIAEPSPLATKSPVDTLLSHSPGAIAPSIAGAAISGTTSNGSFSGAAAAPQHTPNANNAADNRLIIVSCLLLIPETRFRRAMFHPFFRFRNISAPNRPDAAMRRESLPGASGYAIKNRLRIAGADQNPTSSTLTWESSL